MSINNSCKVRTQRFCFNKLCIHFGHYVSCTWHNAIGTQLQATATLRTPTAEIREIFKVTKIGSIAGCMVTNGKILRSSKIRLIRDGVVVYTGELASLKRFKDDAKEVTKGFDCGMQIKNYNDIYEGDIIEAFHEVEVKKKLK